MTPHDPRTPQGQMVRDLLREDVDTVLTGDGLSRGHCAAHSGMAAGLVYLGDQVGELKADMKDWSREIFRKLDERAKANGQTEVKLEGVRVRVVAIAAAAAFVVTAIIAPIAVALTLRAVETKQERITHGESIGRTEGQDRPQGKRARQVP